MDDSRISELASAIDSKLRTGDPRPDEIAREALAILQLCVQELYLEEEMTLAELEAKLAADVIGTRASASCETATPEPSIHLG